MINREAYEQYESALKQGIKYYNACVVRGEYPYPQVLDEILDDTMDAGRLDMGLVDIPAEQIVGTVSVGRRDAFAGNFMPLLGPKTEFGAKWIFLCNVHLSEKGFSDPITCFEYMGRFYVQEGHKRVSVLKSYGAPYIQGYVTRIIPSYSNDPAVQIYYEFMRFYQLCGQYQITFRQKGDYARLQAALGFAPDHVWTEQERMDFRSAFMHLREAFEKLNKEKLPVTAAEALLAWLQVYPLKDFNTASTADFTHSLALIWPDIRILAEEQPIALSSTPPEEEDNRSFLAHLFGLNHPHLNIAFVYDCDPEKSPWVTAHELGRRELEACMGSQITVKSYLCAGKDPYEVMKSAISEGVNVIFAPTPTLIDDCRRIAALHPDVRVFNCALCLPYAGVRSYYSRMYEVKFITGAIAGAMATDNEIGYVANYPIMGVPAAINAFALGAQLTNPRAKVHLRWSCLSEYPVGEFLVDGISVISNRESTGESPHRAWDWGTYMVKEDGSLQALASPRWEWGQFYLKMVKSIMSGALDAEHPKDTDKAVNYWWGLSSGVVDVELSGDLPEGVRQLALILRHGIVNNLIDPFHRVIRDQSGVVRNDGKQWFSKEELMNMDWLCENVVGEIPRYDQLLPKSQALVRVLGLYRDDIPPEETK